MTIRETMTVTVIMTIPTLITTKITTIIIIMMITTTTTTTITCNGQKQCKDLV